MSWEVHRKGIGDAEGMGVTEGLRHHKTREWCESVVRWWRYTWLR